MKNPIRVTNSAEPNEVKDKLYVVNAKLFVVAFCSDCVYQV